MRSCLSHVKWACHFSGTLFARTSPLVPLVRHILHPRAQFRRATNSALNFNERSGVRVVAMVFDDTGFDSLEERVAVGLASLVLVAQAPVPISLFPRVVPKRRELLREQIVHELRDGAVEAAHE